ncbi:hypothetical protein CH254_15955 [Rhodococcus sp. 06-412-2C]|nr:hypothetical protein CH254_15955 [Rhodococcus sp. 06-412-2C]OZD00613.1 hypothetical protein CH279_06320 [Rhodococcus sp. 06-412-2B]
MFGSNAVRGCSKYIATRLRYSAHAFCGVRAFLETELVDVVIRGFMLGVPVELLGRQSGLPFYDIKSPRGM